MPEPRSPITEAPPIDTERLELRAHRLDDFAHSAALWGDPAVTRYIGGRPFTQEEVWTRLLRYAGHWALLGFGYWVVRERGSGRFVGEVGFAEYRREIDPPLDAPEAGWMIAPHAHGAGYATEAMRAALTWAAAHLGGRTVCIIHPDNSPSIRLAAKLGYVLRVEASYRGEPTLLFDRPARSSGET
jgi:RimJ/RimL family protein N-acetyltransferase